MHEIYELKEMLCKELEEYGRKGELTPGSLEIVDKLAHATKNLGKILEMAEESEYSYESYAGGGNRGGGQGGNSRARGGYAYARDGRGGSYAYARGRGSNARRDRMGRYSGEDGYSMAEEDMSDMVMELREIATDLPDDKKREVMRFVQKMEQM